MVGVGPAQKAWMSGTGKEQVKPEERWQRCSDQEREILAAMQRGRDRSGEESRAHLRWRFLGRDGAGAWSQRAGPAKSAECHGPFSRLFLGRCWQRGITSRGLWSVEGGERTYGDQRWLLRRRGGARFMRGAERVSGAAPVDFREKFSFSFVIRSR